MTVAVFTQSVALASPTAFQIQCDDVSPEAQTMVAGHAQQEEIRLAELNLSEQADVICWHYELSVGVERYVKPGSHCQRSTRKFWGAVFVDYA